MSEVAVKLLKAFHAEAEKLAKEWWPDTAKYPAQKRMAELALMRLLIQIEYARMKK